MANPNSLLTRFRFHLAQWLDPYPDKGEAWCIECELNGGRTLIVPASGHTRHLETHRSSEEKSSNVAIRVNWGDARNHDLDEED